MSIQSIGFLDTMNFTAMLAVKYRDLLFKSDAGILPLRIAGDGGDFEDTRLLKEFRSAKALLSRVRAGAAPFFGGVTPELGRAWVELLQPHSGTPWTKEEGEEADTYVRTRTCLVPCPLAISHSGQVSGVLSVGVVNAIEHRALCAEVNHGDHARIHLIVDIMRPDPESDGE